MELAYDWRAFQDFFGPAPRKSVSAEGPTGPVWLVREKGIVVAAFAEGEDLSDWVGATVSEVEAHYKPREVLAFEREKLDEMVNDGLPLHHYDEQVEGLRKRAVPKMARLSRHFLLRSIEAGWLPRFLPKSYGVWLRVTSEKAATQDLLLLVRQGRIESFHEPDLETMGSERAERPDEVVKYLGEKHLLKVQGWVVQSEDWKRWSSDPHPWRKILWALRSKRAHMAPRGWGARFLLAMKALTP